MFSFFNIWKQLYFILEISYNKYHIVHDICNDLHIIYIYIYIYIIYTYYYYIIYFYIYLIVVIFNIFSVSSITFVSHILYLYCIDIKDDMNIRNI